MCVRSCQGGCICEALAGKLQGGTLLSETCQPLALPAGSSVVRPEVYHSKLSKSSPNSCIYISEDA